MAYQNQQFFGAINATTIEKENFIIANGNFASGSERIADFSIVAGDENLLRVSQSIFSVGGAVPTDTYIKSIDGSIVYLSVTASTTVTGDTIGISTPSGSYLINSASWNDPNNAITVNDISGSDEGQDYAILGVAQRNGSIAKGVFHAYKIKEVVYRDLSTSRISFFVEWGEEGTEADSGDVLRITEKALAVVNLSDTGSLAPGFSREVAGLENLTAGSEFSGYNIALNQYFAYLSASVPATASTADRATSASIADFSTTSSYALTGDGVFTGSFSGSFSGSNYSTEFTFDGDTLIVSGNVFVDGTLDAATKNFKINHPTLEDYYLVHSSLEGPERGIYIRGKLEKNNTIILPDYWKELTNNEDITVQLTPIGNSCQHYTKLVTNKIIVVNCNCGEPHCYYLVQAQRYDQGEFETLEPKTK
jgi:hypothetical protein